MFRSFAFLCLVHNSQFGWRVILDLLDQRVGAGRAVSKEFGFKSADDNWEVLNVWSVLQMGIGSASGIVTGDWKTLV